MESDNYMGEGKKKEQKLPKWTLSNSKHLSYLDDFWDKNFISTNLYYKLEDVIWYFKKVFFL